VPGELVLATNTATGKTSPEPVAAVLVHHDTDLYDLRVKSGGRVSVIDTTSNHLFWAPYLKQWVPAGKLKKGERLRNPSGPLVVADGGTVPAVRDGWMWDLTIPGNNDHDFYVVPATQYAGGKGAGNVPDSAVPVLVHNCDNSNLSDLPIHENPGKFYAKAGEMADRIGSNPPSDIQMYGSEEAGNGGVSALSNEDLIRPGGPSGGEPITGYREFAPGDDINLPGFRLYITDGNNRTAEIANRVATGEMDEEELIEIAIGELCI
jgi:hypothetical protein